MLARLFSRLGSKHDFYLESDAGRTFIWLEVRARLLSGIRCVASGQNRTFIWKPMLGGLLSGSMPELDCYPKFDARWTFVLLRVRAGLLASQTFVWLRIRAGISSGIRY